MAARKYDYWLSEDKLNLIEGWAKDGLTLEEVAHNMGIHRKTLYKWQRTYDPIGHALKRGREVADRQVENALFARAIGRTVIEVKVINGKDGERTEKTAKHIPADVTACIYWLKNRKPEQWGERRAETVEADIEDLAPLAKLLNK